MRVLLTNDDGIQAAGPAGPAACAARARRDRARRDRPRLEPQRDGSLDHDALTDVGPGGRVRGRHHGLRDGGHAGRLRPLRRSRPARPQAGPDRLGDQPRLQPWRRRHLLGDGRRRARGNRPRHAGDRRLAAVAGARDGLPRRPRVRLLSRGALHGRARRPDRRARDAGGDADQRQRSRRRARRRRGDEARQAPLRRRAEARRRERGGGPQALPDLRLRAVLRGRGGHRPGRASRAGRSRSRRSTSTSPTTAAWRSSAAGDWRECWGRASEPRRRRGGPRSCAARSPSTTRRTTSRTTRRSPTPTTTSSSTSSATSRPSTRSC